jgi:hypothetical protein
MENEQIKQKFPVGMIIILILIGLVAVSLLFGIFKDTLHLYQLGPVLITGVGAIIINLIILGILGTIFYGIIKKLRWARKLTIGWYVFSMIQWLINLISFLANKTMFGIYYEKTLSPEAYALFLKNPALITSGFIIAFVFSSIVGIIVIVYLVRKKDFFVN